MKLEAANLSVSYGDKTIVHNITVELPVNQLTTIIGPNGCGKSTLLKSLTRIMAPSNGAVLLDGKSIKEEPTKKLAQKMAILPQMQEDTNGLTVAELVSYGRFPYQKGFGRLSKHDKEMIDWALEATSMQQFKHHPVDALSGGQRQRVWIAMALAQETEVIFLDEPTTYLDMAHQLEVLELLDKLNKLENRTIIMVLHDLNQAARYSDTIIAMKDGRIVKQGGPEDIMQPEMLAELYHIDALIGRDPRTKKPILMSYHLMEDEKDEKTFWVNRG
ncbi:ABC transporter ATP-binding protein [Paenalkalicoccus suaedae]|uniref:ABC transporter ATP-binding protein n=2 Tax=Paenalkalicoccus suaedae TaxID=2592382 RepID=A0A859FB68_9BACI|nr:ABC transporter ATP-binding protein [Paenalkalicoccus suaedae]